MKKLNLIIILVLTQSCSWFESDYDKLMNPIKDLKISEQRSGKPNPDFDGIAEPNFPDAKENNKTLEGIDSNQDGVRDDIEIWINRTAEDQYVRWSMKDYYRKYFILVESIIKQDHETEVHRKMKDASDSGHCFSWMQEPYSKIYVEKYHRASAEMRSSKVLDLFPNTAVRSIANSKLNSYQIKGALGRDEDYCKKSEVGNRFIYLINKYKEKTKL